jgi:flagellar motor switch protein FliG
VTTHLFSNEPERQVKRMSEEKKSEMPDAKELKEILNTVSTEIPKLLESIGKVFSNPESANQIGKSVAQFYKELIAAGMTPDQAYQMTREYMASFSLGGLITSGLKTATEMGKHQKDDD